MCNLNNSFKWNISCYIGILFIFIYYEGGERKLWGVGRNGLF